MSFLTQVHRLSIGIENTSFRSLSPHPDIIHIKLRFNFSISRKQRRIHIHLSLTQLHIFHVDWLWLYVDLAERISKFLIAAAQLKKIMSYSVSRKNAARIKCKSFQKNTVCGEGYY